MNKTAVKNKDFTEAYRLPKLTLITMSHQNLTIS